MTGGSIFLGVGNPMRGDDGIGPYAAQLMDSMDLPGWRVINAEMVPENFTGLIRREKPDLLVVFDAAAMGLEPGEARIIPHERIGVMHFSTHAIPLSVFMEQMSGCAGEVILLGIQVDTEKTELGTEISLEATGWARRAVERLAAEGPRSFLSL